MKLLIPATLALVAVASSVDAQKYCGRDDFKVVGDYTVYNILWGEDNDKTGGQCTEVTGSTSSSVSWKTSFNWAGDNWPVKSYANAALKFQPKQVSAIKSIPTSMEYTYTYDGHIIANVAYDLFTSSSESGEVENELMVWLAALGGPWPLTDSGKPIKTVNIGGVDFDLFQGMNKKVKVFSYVAKKTAYKFSADLKKFFNELPTNNTLPQTQYLVKLEADYTVYNNLWGQDSDKTGGQCATVDRSSGSDIAWQTSFNWAGDNWQVKSYANAALKFDPVQISNVTSIPTTMEYTYKYDGNIITNVAYDLFTSPSIGGETAYELMVWLAALGGAWPLTTTGQPIKSVTLGGVEFNLYQGWNNKTKNMATSFTADLKQFFDELPADNTIETTQYLTHVQAGTEPFQGKNASMTVTKYSAAVHTV
ncbi:hypothetical protein PInf_009599 [Phytophthora infestans]|nr:hypothetical protein PInf_009599 [Phytophthora infestans]